MNTKRNLQLAALLLLAPVLLHPSAARAQLGAGGGSLTPPPGAPTNTMLTLSAINPPTPVASSTTPGNAGNLYIISQPGSYRLITNLIAGSSNSVNGIEILANDVTLDLDGFALQGAPLGGYGILIPNAQTNITVFSGALNGWQNAGVASLSANSANLVFDRLNVSANGGGIALSGPGTVRGCNCQYNQGEGLVLSGGLVTGCTANNNAFEGVIVSSTDGGTVTGCMADANGSDGIFTYGGTVADCTANANTADGIGMGAPGVNVYRCTASSNVINGITALSGTVSDCVVQGNQTSGIGVSGPGSFVIGNTCVGNSSTNNFSGAGIYIYASNNRIENNQVTASGRAGMDVSTGCSNNIIIKNSVAGNGANNYIVPANNDAGPIGTAATATSPWANFSH